jgi:hypothetical protein
MSDTEPKKKISAEFVQSVKKYIEIDDKIREFKEINKNLNIQKKEQEEFILNYLQTIEENTIDLKDGTLKKNISKTQTPIKKDIIQKALTEITGDSIKAQEFTDHIIKSRPITERISLRRTTNKKTE